MCFTKKTKFFSPFYQSFENFINYISITCALLPNFSRIYVSFSTWPTLHSNLLFQTHPVQFVLPVYPWMHGHWMGCGGPTRGHFLKKRDPLSFSICQLPVTTQCRGETSCSPVCSSLDFVLLTLSRVCVCRHSHCEVFCATTPLYLESRYLPALAHTAFLLLLLQWFLSLGGRKCGIDVSFKGPTLCSLLLSIFWPGVGLHVDCLLQKEVSVMRVKRCTHSPAGISH